MPTTMARIRKRFRDLATGGMEFVTEAVTASETLQVGDNTQLYESPAGATVVENDAGNPINIQLSPSGRAYLSGNTVETTISDQNTWYEIEGTWDSAHLNFLTHDAGDLTYDGDVTTQVAYQAGGSYISPSNNAEYEFAMFKDGVVKERTIMPFSPARQDEAFSLPTLIGFTDTTTSGMAHDCRVRCTNGATNITVPGLSFTIQG